MTPTRREFISAGLALSIGGRGAAQQSAVLTPEMFGAIGDGKRNDTAAFAKLSSAVNARGGGTIVLRPVIYLVGEQAVGGKLAFTPTEILHFIGCSAAVEVRGNGAVLRCAPGLRYGGFDKSGHSLPDSRNNLKPENNAVPYIGMIIAERCTGAVEISDIELDGNLGAMRIGGKYGSGGWQAAASGIRLIRNRGPERISRVHSHHHPQDGLLLGAAVERTGETVVIDSVCDQNGRQGCSITSGRNYLFQRCKFNRTGRAAPLFRSNPGAGIDIEAEASTIRNVAFDKCEFVDNAGFGLVAAQGDSAGVRFSGCKFVGTTNFSAWPNRPGMRFDDCLFVGQLSHIYGDADPVRATQFTRCTFTDDAKLSPTGTVCLDRAPDKTIALVLQAKNVRFANCRFRLVAEGVLPRSGPDAIYVGCEMSQQSRTPARMRGTFLGTTTIVGPAQLTGSKIVGDVRLNGRIVPPNG